MKRFDRIYIEITNVCNLKCKFCDETSREKKFMSVDEFEKIITQVKDYTNLIALHIKGEPLLHPNFKKILDICLENNLLVNITTNGTLLSENIQILGENKAIRQINLSMHALIQNNINIKENIYKTFEAVKMIKKINNNIIFSYRLWNIESLKDNDINKEILEMIGNEYNIKDIFERSKNERFIELEKKVFLNQDIQFEWPSLNKKIIGEVRKVLWHKETIMNSCRWKCCTMLYGPKW